jgi:hypothetical protein
MSIQSKRAISSAQVKMRKLMIDITAATSAVSGFDRLQIKEVIKNAPGDFTIILKRPFKKTRAEKARAMVMPMAAGITSHLAASDHDRVNVVLSADVDLLSRLQVLTTTFLTKS